MKDKEQKKAKLQQELGKLTFEMAKLRESWEKKVKCSNAIGAELEKLDGA